MVLAPLVQKAYKKQLVFLQSFLRRATTQTITTALALLLQYFAKTLVFLLFICVRTGLDSHWLHHSSHMVRSLGSMESMYFQLGYSKPRHFLAWHGAVIETIGFLDAFEISGNLKSSQKVAIFRKDGAYIERNRYVASFPEMLIYNWNNQILYAIITVKFSFTVRVFCWDNFAKLCSSSWSLAVLFLLVSRFFPKQAKLLGSYLALIFALE